MAKRHSEISETELRQLFVEKQRAARQQRLAHYHKTGRVVQAMPKGDASEHELVGAFVPSFGEDLPNRPVLSFRSKLLNRLLLLVEVLAVGTLLFVFFNGIEMVRAINQGVVNAFIFPTPTATPLVRAVVLPSGHTPPTSPGGARPNEAEIPEHLRPLVQSLASIPIPTPAPAQAIRIQIPAIGIDAPIIQGTGWDQLKKGVGQYLGSANPGQDGNMVLAAHNDIFGELFRDLDQLKPGDQITIYSSQRAYTYVVTGWKIVAPTQVEVMNPTPNATATLISCYPYLVDTERIVVKTKLVES
ncbi:MAG: sortase [Anaerolineales bacterium]